MDDIYKQVLQWFQGRSFIKTDVGDLAKITLSHAGQTRKQELLAFVSEDFGAGDWDPEDLCARAMQAAEADVQGLGGTQRYILEAFYGARKRPASVQRFRLTGPEDLDLDSEPANSQGLMTQLMRHNEVATRLSAQGAETVIRYLSKSLDRANERIEQLEARQTDMMETYETLITRKHERDLETIQVTAQESRKDEAFETLKLLAPAVVNRIAGKQLLPETISAEGMAIKSFVESLTQEQMEKMGTVLNAPQMISVLEMANKYLPGSEDKGNGLAKREP